MSDAPELLPCPFCGGAMEDRGYGAVHIAGPVCPIGDLAIDVVRWNRRAALSDHPAVKALVAEAEARIAARMIGVATSQTQWSPYTYGTVRNACYLRGVLDSTKKIEAAIRAEAAALRKEPT